MLALMLVSLVMRNVGRFANVQFANVETIFSLAMDKRTKNNYEICLYPCKTVAFIIIYPSLEMISELDVSGIVSVH